MPTLAQEINLSGKKTVKLLEYCKTEMVGVVECERYKNAFHKSCLEWEELCAVRIQTIQWVKKGYIL